MKKYSKYPIITVLVAAAISLGGVLMATPAYAAQAVVGLGTTAPFAILAGTPNITDAGNTSVITGNVGLSPASGAAIGLLCSQVTGTIYSVDAAGPLPCRVTDAPLLTTAKSDLVTAYDDAAGRTPVSTVPTELGGTTKTAGVYDSASTTFGITAGAGPLILDAQGDPTAVFIFEMNSGATGLTVGPGSTVTLANGAQACNVFWRLNTAAINTTAVFKGTILALTSITVANGANIEGRLLARNGNVTLVNDTITVPDCATSSAAIAAAAAQAAAAAEAEAAAAAAAAAVPKLPNTGIGGAESKSSTPWQIIIPSGAAAGVLSVYLVRKKRTSWSKY